MLDIQNYSKVFLHFKIKKGNGSLKSKTDFLGVIGLDMCFSLYQSSLEFDEIVRDNFAIGVVCVIGSFVLA